MAKARETYKTALEWAIEGRIVKGNTRPRRFLVGHGTKLGLYTRSQTVNRTDLTNTAREDLPESQPKTIRYRYDGKRFVIHLGNRKGLHKVFKANGFVFIRKTMRWYREATPDQAERMLEFLRSKGYTPFNEEGLDNR